MKDEKQGNSGDAFGPGEHLIRSVMMAMIAERHPPGSPMRSKLEAWVEENIPSLIKERSETGDLLGAFTRRIGSLKVLLSQKEAARDLREEATGIEANKKAVSDALAAGNVRKALETRAFYLLKAERFRDLKHPDIQSLIALASQAGDKGVFIRLGRALSLKPEITSPEDIQLNNLKFLLVECWLGGPEGQIGLCRLTDEALTEFCNLALGRHDLHLATVRKARYRLGLIKGAKPWFTRVKKTKDGIVISAHE